MARLRVRGISKSYPGAVRDSDLALSGVDLDVASGEFVCLLGPSGCGKTTLLNLLAGLDRADAGTVETLGTGRNEPILRLVFQEDRLLPWRTVFENLAFVLDGPRPEQAQRIHQWLERVGLQDTARMYPGQLSIGMRQRLAVARALITEPDVLLMDEPFSSLDELTAMTVREELIALWQATGCTVVFVTHNPVEAALLADRILIMRPRPGRIVEELDLRGVLSRPRDPDDERLWHQARLAVHKLREGAGSDELPTLVVGDAARGLSDA